MAKQRITASELMAKLNTDSEFVAKRARSADSRARAALMELGTDPDLMQEIQVILDRLKRARR